jgi:lipopolysaccharide export system permease protein
VLVFRYLAKEVLVTLLALTVVLMVILVSNQMVGYLNRAASGRIPGILVMQLMLLEMPNLLSLLMPLGFYVSVILAYGRLYSENEMLVFQVCGLSNIRLLGLTLFMASFVAMMVAWMVYLNPGIASQRARLLQTTGVKAFIQMLTPKRFQQLPGDQVLYIDGVNRQHTKANGLFVAQLNHDPTKSWRWQVIAAHDLEFLKAHDDKGSLLMHQGQVYHISPGALEAQYGTFDKGLIRLPEPKLHAEIDLRTMPFQSLWNERKESSAKNAELQWRISIVLMTLVLSFVAVPLSRVNPRQGKFSKILPAILIFLLYTNFLFMWREKVAWGAWSSQANMMVVHIGVLVLAGGLFWLQKRRFVL